LLLARWSLLWRDFGFVLLLTRLLYLQHQYDHDQGQCQDQDYDHDYAEMEDRETQGDLLVQEVLILFLRCPGLPMFER
jgi:hypothetical protein